MEERREPVLSPIDRVSEMLFGLFMALTFVGAVSAATAGREEIRTMFIAALGCNLAWGLVDAVMYLVRTIVGRGRVLTLARAVRNTGDAAGGRRHIEDALPEVASRLLSAAEIEAMRGRIVAMPTLPDRPRLHRDDLLGAIAIFVIVVAATFPVVLPFVIFSNVATAQTASRAIALAMLFGGGLALGRHAGYGSLRTGFAMMTLGIALVAAIMALGG